MSSTLTRPENRSAQPPAPGERELRNRLAGLRRRLWLVVLCRGGSWLVACLFLTLLAAGWIDYRIQLPSLVRAVLLVGLLSGMAVILYRLLLRPLADPKDDLSLALRIEDRYPLLNDSLASTVQFLHQTQEEIGTAGDSVGMRREAIRRALGKIAGLDFNKVIDNRGTRSAILAAILALGMAVPVVVLWPAQAGTAVARLGSPFSSIDWPRKTRIHLDDVLLRIGRGREYRLRGNLTGEIPREVTLEMSHEGFPVQRKTWNVGEGDSFVIHLKPDEVQRHFRFRILANDAVTPEYSVEVLSLPRLVSFEGKPSPRIRIDIPSYTDLPSPQWLAPGTGALDVIAGSVVTLTASADRPLGDAWISYQPELAGTMQAAILAPIGMPNPLNALGTMLLSRGIHARVHARIGSDRRRFEVVFRPSVHGQYLIGFTDTDGLSNSQLFDLRLRLDPAPTVRLERPAKSKDALQVLATAELPLAAIAEDPVFAVRSVWLEYRTQHDEAPRRLPLYDAASGLAREIGPWSGAGVVATESPRLRLPRLEFRRLIRLVDLRHPDGSILREGDTVTLQVRADDFDDVSVGKLPGESHRVVINIVSREAFDAEINREQTRIQKELVAQRDKQRDALAKIREVEERIKNGGKLSPHREAALAEAEADQARRQALEEREKAEKASGEDRQKHEKAAQDQSAKAKRLEERAQQLRKEANQLADAEQQQQQIRERIGNSREGLRSEIDRLKETLRQNGMATSSAMERMKNVARELDRLAESDLQQIEPKLANVRKMSELQDEKAWQERRITLEDRARQEELAAREAEARARKLEDRARAIEESSKDGDARKQAEARALREQAATQARRAKEQRAQAERDRRDAAEKPDPTRIRKELQEARRGQEEVDKGLTSLLKDLEPWSSSQEVAGEASRIVGEQKELQAQIDELIEKGQTGQNPDTLKPEERAQLESLQDKQRRLAERTAKLLEQMNRLAEQRAERDPETSKELKQAADRAEKNNLVGQMKSAREKIAANKLNEARKDQSEALAELEKMKSDLEKSREARLDRLARKLREAEQRVSELLDEQEKLQRKIRDAAKIKDEKQRDEELARLAKRQRELQKKTEEAMAKVSRAGNDRARQALEDASDEMKEAVKRLEARKPDDEKQEDALDRLDEAMRELEQARKKAEEELGREQIARVADAIRRIRDRQEGHVTEAKRIQDKVVQLKGWSRVLISFRDLGENQKGLAEETANLAKKDLTAAPVFARMVERSARAMERAAARVEAMKKAAATEEAPDVAALPDAELKRLQDEAMRRLDQVLASLKEAMDEPRALSRPGGGGEQDGDGNGPGGQAGDDSLPPLAQLKMLRMMQKEINDRTAAFKKKHPDLKDLEPKDKADLDDIQKEQKEVADLLAQLTRSGEDDPDEQDKPMPPKDEKKDKKEGEKP